MVFDILAHRLSRRPNKKKPTKRKPNSERPWAMVSTRNEIGMIRQMRVGTMLDLIVIYVDFRNIFYVRSSLQWNK